MDRYVVLFIIAAIVFTIFALFHIKRRIEKYKGVFDDHFEKLIAETGRTKSLDDTDDIEPPDSSKPKQ